MTKRPQITGRVDGSLRDRIAYAIAQADGDLPGMSTMQQFALMHSGSHNTKEGGTVPDTLRERIAPDDLCKCGHRAHRHDNFGLSRCCHYRECGCHHFDLAVRWRGDE